MADDNKPIKYARYAIGEIILVVIGILIALQINNWNENRKALIKENSLYSSIVSDLEVDKDKLEVVLEGLKSFHNTQSQVFNESIGEAVFDKNTYYEDLRWGERFNPIVKENHNITIATISNERVRLSASVDSATPRARMPLAARSITVLLALAAVSVSSWHRSMTT